MGYEPGIYFDMSDEDYHADPAIGSTGGKKLLASPPDFWWNSWMNPAREEEKETPGKFFGKALHRCVLEGRDKFLAEYAPLDHPGNVKAGKEEREYLAAIGMKGMKREDWARVQAAGAFITANPHLRQAFTNGHPEVSVFWNRGDVRMKCRFDFLKVRAIVDLKSVANQRGKAFPKACMDASAEYAYPISAAWYCEGREHMAKLAADGAIHGDYDSAWLAQVVNQPEFAFVFVFWQSQGSPISTGLQLSPNSPILSNARLKVNEAVETYRRFMAEFGTETAWMINEPLEEMDESKFPAWYQFRQLDEGK